MTGKQLEDIIEAFLKREKRFPTANEVLEVAQDNTKKGSASAAITRCRQKAKRLHVVDGQIYDEDGEMIWFQQTVGSLMPARYYPDTGLGQTISG